jgi:hypothetical protein
VEPRQEIGAGDAYGLLVERLRELADALAALDAGHGALDRSAERRSLLREQAYLLSALAGLDGTDQSLN